MLHPNQKYYTAKNTGNNGTVGVGAMNAQLPTSISTWLGPINLKKTMSLQEPRAKSQKERRRRSYFHERGACLLLLP
eukprot:scaffold1271_cov149-Skeletonema_dohrnii-CCMP3373.AAC.2